MDIGSKNELWAQQLVDALIAQGIEYFACAPGSRSTPLALAISRLPKQMWSVHFDERGVCFHAVGYGKAKGKPAALLTTSGTAVGNLLPGIMEAFNERVPLLLLTSDRPPELRDCGANQTCDQNKLFTNHVRWFVDLPCPSEGIPSNYLASTIAQAVCMSQSSPAGPVHVNCMFREPLFGKEKPQAALTHHVSISHPRLAPSEEVIAEWAQNLSLPKNGAILVGSSPAISAEHLFALAEKLEWPIFADILSPPRSSEDHPYLIPHFDPILKCKPELKVDALIQFGNRFVSKTLAKWLEEQTPEFYLHVSEHTMRQDPSHLITHRVHAEPKLFVDELLKVLIPQEESQWRAEWKEWDHCCRQTVAGTLSEFTELTEPGLVLEIASHLSEDWALFLANSMPIRDANQFFVPSQGCGPLFGNRGVSGIDGNIATAAGFAKARGKPVLALIGDLAFLHDLNSLAYLTTLEPPVVICVVNNNGGGIFSFLPIANKAAASFESFYGTPHDLSFGPAATLFGLPYYHPSTPGALREALAHQTNLPHSCILEITTDRQKNVAIHEYIQRKIQEKFSFSDNPTFC